MNPPFSKVLYIHGNSQELLASAIILSRIGPQVHLASDGERGLELAEEYVFDLIILAETLKEGTGMEVYSHLSWENRCSTVLVFSQRPDLSEARKKYPEALDFIDIPHFPMKLVATICEYLINKFENQNEESPLLIIN